MKPIVIFYHCAFLLGDPPARAEAATGIVAGQMGQLINSGLMETAEEIVIGINGAAGDSGRIAQSIFPQRCRLVFHGLESKSENLTLVEVEKWLAANPAAKALILYLHSKGISHPIGSKEGLSRARWRECMMRACVGDWRGCVVLLERGYESVGCHWMTWTAWPHMPPGQSIWAGNCWWATSDYLRTLPSIYERERIKVSGIGSAESRYEAEVWIGNGKRLPRVKELAPGHRFGQCP